ncbi:glyoxalase [Pedobacter sp. BS3]|uniref:VOC family protein n=1 Tax=Pedobacter sp. BS3 TaxID=2567937 RepID=UPI0011EBF1FE|nr:VOC family protein [Pedobacter sp. BS3]TZF83991.1 glyoxalase [Pedobacter sp. BS3]
MKSIGIISVPVTDQQKSKEFYLKMGLSIIAEAPMGNGQTWVQMGFPEGDVSITLVTWFPKMPAGSLHGATILTDDIVAEKKRLLEAGIETGKIDETPWGKFAFVTDPDGNSWVLHEK